MKLGKRFTTAVFLVLVTASLFASVLSLVLHPDKVTFEADGVFWLGLNGLGLLLYGICMVLYALDVEGRARSDDFRSMYNAKAPLILNVVLVAYAAIPVAACVSLIARLWSAIS